MVDSYNEEEYIPYSLPAIFRLEPDEVVLIFDRCTDRSMDVAKKIAQKFECESSTKFVELNESSPDWNFRLAFVRRHGFRLARNSVILNTDADMILDKNVKKEIRKVGKNGIALVSFGFFDFPYTIQCFTRRIISTISPITGFAGQYAFSKKAWLETEDQESVKKVRRSEDTHLRLSLLKKYKIVHVNTKSIHIRPNETKKRHYLRGVIYWELVHYSLWGMFLHSIINLRPAAMAGYLHARSSDVSVRGKFQF